MEHHFHDFKKQGVPEAELDRWLAAVGWETLINRKGTAWRQLDEAVRAGVTNAASARAVALANPSVIKRPVVQWADGITVGFDAAAWQRRL
ncbi:Protein YffB [compost metagenome]